MIRYRLLRLAEDMSIAFTSFWEGLAKMEAEADKDRKKRVRELRKLKEQEEAVVTFTEQLKSL